MEKHVTYLGDSVTARLENGVLVLTASNGKIVTSEIYIENFVLFAIINYALLHGLIKNV